MKIINRMKQEYDIFLAGSKSLDRQRNLIKATIASRNATAKLNSIDCVLFSVYTYENFPAIIDDTLGKQSSYNSFIREKADLAIFILDGVIGDKTKTEFEVAYNSLTKSPRRAPGIIVFSKKIPHQDSGVAHIQKFLSENNQYYIEYENDAQLPAILDDNLNKYIQDQRSKEFGRRRRVIKLTGRIVLAVLLVLLLVVAGIGVSKCSKQKKERAREQVLQSVQRLLDDYHKNGNNYEDESLFITSLKELEKNGIKEGKEVQQLNEAVTSIHKMHEDAQKEEEAQNRINEILIKANAWLLIPDLSTKESLLKQLRQAVELAEEYSLSREKLDGVIAQVNETQKNIGQPQSNNGGDDIKSNKESALVSEVFSVSSSSLVFGASGASLPLNLYATSNWTVKDIPSWIQLSSTSGGADSKSQLVRVTVSSNTGPQRSARLLFVSGSKILVVSVLQKESDDGNSDGARDKYKQLERYEEKWIAGEISLQEYKAQINAVLPALQEAGLTEQVKALKDFLAKH